MGRSTFGQVGQDWDKIQEKNKKKTSSKKSKSFQTNFFHTRGGAPLWALGTLPPYGLLAPSNRLLVPPPGQHCPPSRKCINGSTMGCGCWFTVEFEWDFFSQNWLNSHFRTHDFLFLLSTFGGCVGGFRPKCR